MPGLRKPRHINCGISVIFSGCVWAEPQKIAIHIRCKDVDLPYTSSYKGVDIPPYTSRHGCGSSIHISCMDADLLLPILVDFFLAPPKILQCAETPPPSKEAENLSQLDRSFITTKRSSSKNLKKTRQVVVKWLWKRWSSPYKK